VLAQGGNAVDGAVAAALAAFVCELPLCSPLGGGVMLVEPAGQPARALDLFARTPGLGGDRPAALDFCHVQVDFGAATQVFHVGRGSAAVPVALPGLVRAHERWGRLPLSEVAAPAVELGRGGYTLGAGVAFAFDLLTPIIETTTESRELFASGDRIATAGAALNNPRLADMLEGIARKPELVGDVYAALCREFGPKQGGLISEQDVAAAQVLEAEPVRTRYGEWELATMPGPSTGGVLVALGLGLSRGMGALDFLSPEHVLAIARIQEVLSAVRDQRFDERCRDPEQVRELLSEPNMAKLRADALGAEPENPLGSTTHISVIDGGGGAVALTLTNGEGSGYVLSGTGMVVNNLLGEEDIHPRGFHRDPPGRALSTMMAPTLLWRGGDRMALGSGGSNRLRNAILQVLAHLLEHGVEPQRAVIAPRLHLERTADGPALAFEAVDLASETAAALTAAYPNAVARFDSRSMFFGGVHLALRIASRFQGAGDPRRGGSSVVVGAA
jgi:gamma-glutamyltranspeptidase/glutathione hydrolase